MFRNLKADELTGRIDGLPEGWEILFFANIFGTFGPHTFLAIICPCDALLDMQNFRTSLVQAKIAFFHRSDNTITDNITCAQKTDDDEFIVSWRRNHDPWYFRKFGGVYSFMGISIPAEKIVFSRL